MSLPVHNNLYKELLSQLQQIDYDDPIKGHLKAIDICQEKLQALYHWVKNHTFPDAAAEIDFFKNVKPLFLSRLIYYQEIFRYHLHIPPCGEEAKKAYMNTFLAQITQFYTDQHEFFAYYRGRYTNCDDAYFTRSHYHPFIAGSFQYTEYEVNFCTNYDSKLARLLSYEQIAEYLQHCPVHHAVNSHGQEKVPGASLTWSLQITDFVELAYGLHTVGAYNNGNADLKQIVAVMAACFHIHPGNVYRIFLELRSRKNGRTKFLDKMRDALNRRMDEQDE